MIGDLGLIATIGICAWIALDGLTARRGPGYVRLAAVGVAVLAWCAGELLLRHADDPAGMLWSRRLLYAGLCAFGPLWLWTVLGIHSPRGIGRRARAAVIAMLAVEAGVYASLYLEPAWLVTGDGRAPVRGPLFAVHAVVQWGAILAAIGCMAAAVTRLPGQRGVAAGGLVLGSAVPVLANWLYIAFGSAFGDPTPIAVGLGALAFRLYLLDLLGLPSVSAFARSELFDQLEVGILVSDMDGIVLDANAQAQALLGGRDPRDAPLDATLASVEREPGFDVRRFPIRRRNVEIGQGAIVADRRHARALERRVDVASRMEALGVLSRGLAHEINNPLTEVVGHASLLERLLTRRMRETLESGPPEGREVLEQALVWVDRVASSGDRIARVVERMSALIEPEPVGELPFVDLTSAVRKAIGLAEFGRAESRVRWEGDAPTLYAAARGEDVIQIVLHLILHALLVDESQSVEVVLEGEEDEVRVRVRDRSTTLPEAPDQVFDAAHAAKHDGRGVGLVLAWEIARQNAGDLRARRRVEGGAELVLTLPTPTPL